jgi:adhesin/invasin
LSAGSCTTTAGTCSVTLTATVAGSYSITASLAGRRGGTNPGQPACLWPEWPRHRLLRVAISSGPKTANGSDAYTFDGHGV